MDFMKLLKKFRGDHPLQPVQEHPSDLALSSALLAITAKRQQTSGTESTSEAIQELSDRFETLLQILKQEFAGRLENPVRAFASLTGIFESDERKKNTKMRTPFLYLRVPSRPGYLMEEAEMDHVFVYRASESRTLLWNDSDATVSRTPLFARKHQIEAELVRVQPDLWEATWMDETRQTLSTHQIAQIVLAKAMKELVAP